MCWNNCFSSIGALSLMVFMNGSILAQEQTPAPDTLARILNRLDALERQNQALLEEVKSLREEVKATRAGAEVSSEAKTESSESSPQNPQSDAQQTQDRLDVAEQQIKDQAQTKVEASQRFPITLNGMLLFNAFLNSGPPPVMYGEPDPFASSGGATVRQSVLGLEFRGPQLPWGGQVHGSLSMDFFAQSPYYDDVFRIRTGVVSLDWKRRSIIVGQDRSLISPFQPTSFARVGIPPLDGAGNLWLWRPQIRYEERIPITTKTQATLQVGVVETDERYSLGYLQSTDLLTASRPAIQAHGAVRHQWSDDSWLAIGLGFHSSETQLYGQSIKSRVVSTDLSFKPIRQFELTGTLFRGENFANIGGGPPGLTFYEGTLIPIHGAGGWTQLAFPVTSRVTFDLYAGRQVNEGRDLVYPAILKTLTYAGNILYRISPNVVIGLEASQQRLTYLDLTNALTNRYDASVAYLF